MRGGRGEESELNEDLRDSGIDGIRKGCKLRERSAAKGL